jgi:hypothetical protein
MTKALRSLYSLSFTICCFWLPFCLFGHCIFCPLRYTASGYTFVSLVIVFSVLYDILLLVTLLSLLSLCFLSFTIYCFWLHICLFGHCIFCPLRYTASGYTFVKIQGPKRQMCNQKQYIVKDRKYNDKRDKSVTRSSIS